MSPIEKQKIEKEFIEDLILYLEYSEISPKEISKITLEEFKKSGLKN
jgi:hypothetical protein